MDIAPPLPCSSYWSRDKRLSLPVIPPSVCQVTTVGTHSEHQAMHAQLTISDELRVLFEIWATNTVLDFW